MKYRAEIDGLRALAVVPVLLYHSGLELASGGFLGVDVFFVISGFLITNIIYQQSLHGCFSIIRFYDRRVRRILPPLIISALLTIILAITFTPSDIKFVGQSLVATFTFLSNFYFYLKTDYFNPFNQVSPMLHTWSLSVEEQFYLFAPFMFYFLSQFKSAKYVVVAILLTISFSSAVFLTVSNASLSFYSIHTRAWELLIGSLLAFVRNDLKNFEPNALVSELFALLSLLLLTLSYVFIDENAKHPSFVTLIPVFSTALLIFFSEYTTFVKKLLSNRFFVWIGLLSYSLYLLHNPIFSFIEYHTQQYTTLIKIFSLIFIYILSILSFRYVEAPLRSQKTVKAKILYPALLCIVGNIVALGYLAHTTNGFLNYFKNTFKVNENLVINVKEERKLIENMRQLYAPSDSDFSCTDNGCKNILVVGDSFAEDAYLSLNQVNSKEYSIRRLYYDDECLKDYDPGSSIQSCHGDTLDIHLLDAADIVVVTSKWQESTYLDGYNFAASILDKYDVTTFLVGSVMFEDLSSFAFRLQEVSNDTRAISRLAYAHQRFDRLKISDKLRELAYQNPEIHWIEKSEFFCDRSTLSCSVYDKNFDPLIWDNAHLTTRAYLPFGQFLLNLLTFNASMETD